MRIIDLLYVISERDCDFIITINKELIGFYTLGELTLNDRLNELIIKHLKSKSHNSKITYIIDCIEGGRYGKC